MKNKRMLVVIALTAPLICGMAQTKKGKVKMKDVVEAFAKPVVPEVPKEDRIDTIYYDKNWRVIRNKDFASYYRYALYPADSLAAKTCRTYYIDGDLQGESDFENLSTSNDKESLFVGTFTSYYKSGKPEIVCNYKKGKLEGDYSSYKEDGTHVVTCKYQDGALNGKYTTYYDDGKPAKVCNYNKGVLDGELITYYESGLIHEYVNMKEGKKQGIESIFSQNSETCKQLQYGAKEESKVYIVTDKRGNCSLYDMKNDSSIHIAPTEEEMKTEYQNGVAWNYYYKNGLILGVSQFIDEQVGSYRELQFFLSNNSMNNVDIDPETIEVYTIKKGEHKPFEFMSSEDYYKKVYKKEKKDAKAVTKNKAVVKKDRRNYLNNNLGATTFDDTKSTVADFQQRMIKKKDLTMNSYVMADNKPKDIEYLQRTTVHPGESISGYLFIDDKNVDELHIDVNMNDILYPFAIDLSEKE